MMNRLVAMAASVALLGVPAAFAGPTATVDFEELMSGDTFGPGGTGGEMVGDLVFSDEGIDVRVDDFLQTDQSVFNSASAFIEVDGMIPQEAFVTQGIEFFGNVALEFDFAGVGFNVGRVELEWADFGGSKTIGVNGVLFGFGDVMDAPGLLDGVVIEVIQDQTYPSGVGGRIVFTGDISTITIGGQEFGVDNVVASIPAPGGVVLAVLAGLVVRRRR